MGQKPWAPVLQYNPNVALSNIFSVEEEPWAPVFLLTFLCLLVGGQTAGLAAWPPNAEHMERGGGGRVGIKIWNTTGTN